MGKGRKKKGRAKGADAAEDAGSDQLGMRKAQDAAEDKVTGGNGEQKLSRKQKRMLKLQKKQQKQMEISGNGNSEDEDNEEDEEDEEEPVSKRSGFAAMESEDEEDEEEEEESPKEERKKKSAFAMMESSDEDEDEEDADDSGAASAAKGFGALALSDDDSGEEHEKEKKKEKKRKKEKKVRMEENVSENVAIEEDGNGEAEAEGAEKERKKEKKERRKKKKDKLSNKEKRKLKAEMDAAEREKALKAMSHKETDFAVSATANTMTQEAWENATDIDIPQFTVSAYGKTLFQDAALKISAGRRYGLVGPNGMGKSTLLKQIARKELKIPPRIDVLYVEQEVVADDTPAVEMVLRADKNRTRLLEEEKELMEKLDSSEDLEEAQLNEMQERLETISQELRASGSDSAEARALSLLHGLGFTAEMQRAATKTFSGGWRMRVSIARALFMQPTLLLLDEPTNHLDLNAVIWLDDYLQKWKSTLLVVSHDQDFLDSVCTDIIHLDQQQLFYYKGNYSVFKVQYVKHLEKMKKAWEKQEKELRALRKSGKSNKKAMEMAAKKKSRETGGAKGRKAKMEAAEQTNASGSLAERQLLRRPKEYEVKFIFPAPTELAPPIIQVDNVAFNYPNGPTLFKGLSFGIDMDSRITIVGPNGVGKSTLLKVITKELDPVEGEVTINRHLRIARYHQHFVDVLPFDESPIDFLRRVHDISYQDGRNRLGKFGLEGTAHTIKMLNLSGGQKSRVVFASLSFQEPHILILDEPTNNLDIESIDALSDAINDFEGGVILVSHDARLICTTDMRLWVCENQTVEEMVGGFDAYRDEILEQLAKQEEEEKRKQEERIAAKEEERKKKLAQLEARKLAKKAKK